MFKNIIFFDNYTDGLTGTWKTFVFQGVLFCLFGFFIVVMPQILVAIVSATFTFIGIACIVIGLKIRKTRSDYRKWRDEFWDPLQ